MLKVNCPNCGAEVGFRSPALPSRVCDYCQTILVRSGGGVEAVGKAAALPFDVSPIQVGLRGTFETRGFEVLGRVRWGWTDGSWNEWLLLFDDGSNAWLGEAMGQYMLLRERPVSEILAPAVQALAAGGTVPIGSEAEVDGEILIVSDAREATCIAAEGELPFTAPAGWTIFSVDLRSSSGRCASLQREGESASFYDGRYVSLAELAPRGLRAIEGWPMPAYAA
jgi:ribosomal protein S27E